jgi:hypothetical protein
MSIQRYDTDFLEDPDISPCPGGRYVLHTDYAALEARCAGLERERDALKQQVNDYDVENDELVDHIPIDSFGIPMTAAHVSRVAAERDTLEARCAGMERVLEAAKAQQAAAPYGKKSIDILGTVKAAQMMRDALAALTDTTTDEVQQKQMLTQCHTCAHKNNDWESPTCRECEGENYEVQP